MDKKETITKKKGSARIEMSVEDFQKLIDEKINEKLAETEKEKEKIKEEAISDYLEKEAEKRKEVDSEVINTYMRESLIQDEDFCKRLISYNIKAEWARNVITKDHEVLGKSDLFELLREKITDVKQPPQTFIAPKKKGTKELTAMARAIYKIKKLGGKTGNVKSNVGSKK